MKSTIKTLGIAFAASTALAGTAYAQRDYGSTGQQQQQPRTQEQRQETQKPAKGTATVTLGNRKINLSAAFAKAYQDALAAVNANDTASLSAKVAAAHSAAKTPDEHYLAYQLQLKGALAAKSDADIATALEGLISTGAMPQEQLASAYLSLGKTRYNLRQFPQATTAFQKALQLDPNNSEAASLLAQTQINGGSPQDAVALLQKQIAQQSAGGAKAPEDLYKRAISTAYKAKMPAVVDLSRQWVAAYPTAANWTDAIRIYRNMNNTDDATTLDLYRLTRAANAMKDADDYDRYAYLAITKGYPGEAKTILQEGVTKGLVDVSKSPFKEEMAEAKTKSAGEEATLATAAKNGLASASAKTALANGDLLYGYGQYDKAAELYRAALKKSGADASLINLHLGMALARSGDKAGATAALNAVTGQRAEIAKYWLAYLSTAS